MVNPNHTGYKRITRAIIASTALLSSLWAVPSLATDQAAPAQICTDAFDYQLTYKGSKVGQIQRQQVWQGNEIKASTSGKVSFLMFNFSGAHHAQLAWNPIRQRYLTREYKQDVKGLSDTSIQAQFSENALTSKLTLNGETKDYSDLEHPIVDFEAIAVQMRHALITQTANEFDFVLQRSEKTSHYYFQVQGEETIKVNGQEFKAIKVSQVKKKDRKLHLWFAPELNYHLIKGSYKRKIIDIEAELTKHQLECLIE